MPKKLEITFDMAKNIANERFNGKYSTKGISRIHQE